MINYAVVIVTYNRVNYLKKEIESLFNQKVRPKKLLLLIIVQVMELKTILIHF